jgi:hypothetical protein
VGATFPENEASVSAMLRMGAKEIGVSTMTRWDGYETDFLGTVSLVFKALRGTKTWLSSISSEDWNEGGRTKVNELMARPIGDGSSEPATSS